MGLVALATICMCLAHSPSGASATGYSEAMQWLRAQQEQGQRFDVIVDQGTERGAVGLVTGEVAEANDIEGERVPAPWVSFVGSHADEYVGPVHGEWGNLAQPSQYRVAVFSETDQFYLQGVYPLDTDGSWESGEEVAHKGRKVAQLVRVDNEEAIAISGGGHTKIDGVEVQIFIRTDVDYLQQTVPLYVDGTWTSTAPIGAGHTIARLVRSSSGRTMNTSEWLSWVPYKGLVRSFWVPQDDPDYGYEGEAPAAYQPGYRIDQRSWVYDDALAALAFTQAGESGRAAAILQHLQDWQSPDGSLPFSFDVYVGQVAENYRRSGALAWVGTAALEYERATGDTEFRPLEIGIANFLLSLQVTKTRGFEVDDPRYGSVLGGVGWYDTSYVYHDEPVEWASTEHNVDAYFFLRDLGHLTGDRRYLNAAVLVKQSLLSNHWNDAQQRFNQGISPSGPDPGKALDLGTWGGLFLLAIGEQAKAESSLAFAEQFRVENAAINLSISPGSFNQSYSSPGPISGYRPYLESDGYEDAPAVVWAEGSWGAILLKERLGLDASSDIESMARMQEADPRGGFVQVTEGRRELPYEFHVWPALAGTAWAAIVEGDSDILWRPDPPPAESEDASLLSQFAPVLRYDTSESYRADSAAAVTDNYVCCGIENTNTLNDSENAIIATGNPSLGHDPLSLAYLGARALSTPTGSDSIDLRGNEGSSETTLVLDAQRMHLEPGYGDHLYGRVFNTPDGGRVLQYWFFYYDNPHAYVGIGAHEGDWEFVQFRLSAEGSPIAAAYSQHGEATTCPWNDVEHPIYDHAIVYVADGSHANYYRAGFHFNGGGWDNADGEGGETSTFTIDDISELSSPSWMLWRGKWGGSDGGSGGSGSPPGPAYQGQSWDDPVAWEEGGETAADCE